MTRGRFARGLAVSLPVALSAALLLGACAPTAAPPPTVPPAVPTAAAKVAATTAAVAPTAAAAAQPAATAIAQISPTVAAVAPTAAAAAAPAATALAKAAPTVAAAVPTLAAGRTYTIGIMQLTTHPALDAGRDGAKKALEDAGFREGPQVRYDLQNAQGQIPNLTAIAQRYRDTRADLVVAVSTPALQAALNVFKDTTTPITFNAVTDPYIAARDIIKSPTDKPAHITGIQSLPPVKDGMQLALKLVPNARRIGMIWTPAEANSEVATRLARDAAKELNVELIEATITTGDEVITAAQSLVARNIDLFFISTDSTVVASLEALVKVANDNRKPFIANDPASAARGASAALGLDYFGAGYESGQQGAQMLQGRTSLPVVRSTSTSLAINTRAAEMQGVSFPPDVIAQAKERFDTISPPKK